jgi:myosin heavy subunit
MDPNVDLTDLSEAADDDTKLGLLLLDVLKSRFDSKKIYSNVGPILVAINPFSVDESLYSDEMSMLFMRGGGGPAAKAKLPPHVWSVAERAHQELLRTRERQTIVIAGESGGAKL